MSKLLVVDDSWLSRSMIVKMLKNNGFDVVEAVDGAEALEKLEGELPDGMVLDLLMPKVDGFGVLEGLRDRGLAFPIIVMSADIQDTSKERCLALGARCVLNKPPDESELLGMLKDVLNEGGEESAS